MLMEVITDNIHGAFNKFLSMYLYCDYMLVCPNKFCVKILTLLDLGPVWCISKVKKINWLL